MSVYLSSFDDFLSMFGLAGDIGSGFLFSSSLSSLLISFFNSESDILPVF